MDQQRRGDRDDREETADAAAPKSCPLGRMCQNPLCPQCFPGLSAATSVRQQQQGSSSSGSRRGGGNNVLAWGGGGGSSDAIPAIPPPLPSKSSAAFARATSADLVELVVVLCGRRDGSRRRALKAIRCSSEEPLSNIRHLLTQEIPSLLPNFIFLRIVGGHVVPVTSDQECGSRKCYKAKHFCPPVSPKPQLLLYIPPAANDNNSSTPRRKTGGTSATTASSSSPPPMAQHYPKRQISQNMLEFIVRSLTEGQTKDTKEGKVLGMIRLNCNATLAEIRKELASQLLTTKTSHRYRFVRLLQGEVTLLTAAQERGDGKTTASFRAYHFAPPYTTQPEIVLLMDRFYTEGEIIEDETKTRELKSLASALSTHGSRSVKAKNPRDMVKEKAPTYINSFLNSAGGVLLLGASDDGMIECVPIAGALDDPKTMSLNERVALARSTKDDIRKLVDCACIKMDPAVDDDLVSTQFVPVRKRSTGDATDATKEDILQAEEEIYNVIEIHVKPGRRSLYFLDNHSMDACERRDGSTNVMDAGTITDALNRGEEEGLAWRGGWRQLRSPFDFNKLMRRLSDPWAGREWLFSTTRQELFRQMDEPSCAMYGVIIEGSRGMGKTCFVSELALRPRNVTSIDVVAHHLCRADDPDTLNPGLFVHSLAAMLTQNFREYRSLMIGSSAYHGESIGATMLRALRIEHCESDPDDAFFRGILRPLQELEIRRSQQKLQKQINVAIPLVVLVDAVDESLVTNSGSSRRGSGATIAHILERGLAQSNGLPPWIKLIVSCRKEMTNVSGSLQRLASQLSPIDLDPDPSSDAQVQQARFDIRLFLHAFMESTRMESPFTGRVGTGVWTHEKARLASKNLRSLFGERHVQWQYEVKSGEWTGLDDLIAYDLDFCKKMSIRNSYFVLGKQAVVADLNSGTGTYIKSGNQYALRSVDADSQEESLTAGLAKTTTSAHGGKSSGYAVSNLDDSSEEKSLTCFYCNESGHVREKCPEWKKEEAKKQLIRIETFNRENELLDALASNSEGNYLYARSVLEDLSGGRIQWEEVPLLPRGLDHLYNRFFRLHLDGGATTDAEMDSTQDQRRKPVLRAVKPVLEVLLAATKRGVTEREIAHAVVAGGACDPTAVTFCLRDIRWSLDIDNSGQNPRYSLRHESIRAWLREEGNQRTFGLSEQHGHAMLAASLLQRCWPQQVALSSWLQSGTATPSKTWYQWNDWEPNSDDEDILNLVTHLILSDHGGDQQEDRVRLLMTVGRRNLDSIYRGKTTALHSACANGNAEAVELLLSAGSSTDISVRGRRPLHVAAGKGHSRICDILRSSGADVSSMTTSGRTALLNAVCSGSVSTVKCILTWIAKSDCAETIDMCQTDTGRTALSIAAEEGFDEIMQLLINARASVYLADNHGRTPLFYAARFGRLKGETVQSLVSAYRGREALTWGECRHKRSALHAAVWHGHWDIVKALLEAGADPNLVEKEGGSPLHEAAYYGSYGHEMAKSRRKDQSQSVPARAGSEQSAAAYFESVRLGILQSLLDTGRCMVDLVESHGCTPLWYAAGFGWIGAVEAILNFGAKVNHGQSPVMHALERGHYGTANILLDHGAQIPESCDIDRLCSFTNFPDELVDIVRAAKREPYPPEHAEKNYKTGTTCPPVPKDAFASSTKEEL